MHLRPYINKKHLIFGWIAVFVLLASCQPENNISKIESLKKQVKQEAKALDQLENNTFLQLEEDFISCDMMLQNLHPEEIDEAFQQLQLVGAYINQFKSANPIMKAEMDSTLIQLDNLKADAESHYLSDSLVAVYITDEEQHIEKLRNQIEYFKDRFGICQKDLDNLKKKK